MQNLPNAYSPIKEDKMIKIIRNAGFVGIMLLSSLHFAFEVTNASPATEDKSKKTNLEIRNKQQDDLTSGVLTMGAFLDRLTTSHPLFKREDLASEIYKVEMDAIAGVQDWNFLSSLGMTSEEPAINFSGPDRTDATSLSAGIEKVMWGTGARLSASLTSAKIGLKLPAAFAGAFPEDLFQSEAGLTYSIPLVKNRGGFLDRLQYELKLYDVDVSEVSALENKENFIALASEKFLDWVFITEQHRIIKDRLALNEGELERIKRKRTSNLVDEVDVIRAQDAVLIAKQSQVLVESRWKALQAERYERTVEEFEDALAEKKAALLLKWERAALRTRLRELEYSLKMQRKRVELLILQMQVATAPAT